MIRPRADGALDWFAFTDDIRDAVFDINQDFYMSLKLQGLAQKMALLKHNLELDADKLSSGIDAADAKRVATIAKSTAFVEGAKRDLAEVEQFISSLDVTTNGAPPLDKPTPLPPLAPPGAAVEAQGTPDHVVASGTFDPSVTKY